MDAKRLAALRQGLGAFPSRRTVLRAVAGIALGAWAGMIGPAAAPARKRRTCKGNKKRCGKRCIPKTACCRCPAGTFCQHGGCFVGCSGATPGNCLVGGDCGLCAKTVAGPNVCAEGVDCTAAQPCENDGGCPIGQVCTETGCCTSFGKTKTCNPPNSA